MREGLIVKKSIDFSLLIFKYCGLLEGKRQFIFSNQLLKSGTSIGANVFEAQYAESRIDFIHKMKIALKEANETLYWLTLCEKIGDPAVDQDVFVRLNEILTILSRIISPAKEA
jgi:four helix bundle protein